MAQSKCTEKMKGKCTTGETTRGYGKEEALGKTVGQATKKTFAYGGAKGSFAAVSLPSFCSPARTWEDKGWWVVVVLVVDPNLLLQKE